MRFGWGLLVSLLCALGALLFVVLMNLGIGLLWSEVPGPEPFSGSMRILIIMTVSGLIVGLIHHFVDADEVNVLRAMVLGKLNHRFVPGALLVAMTSLIGGFSLGPEVPGALLPVPLALAAIVLLITGIPAVEAIPVFVSAIVAYSITHGLGLLGRSPTKEQIHNDESVDGS